jgi:octaprenyl-diphosphate synthase
MRQLIAAGATYLHADLQQVDEKLRELLDSEIPAVVDLGRHLLESGGKRFRPALTLLFYQLLGSRGSHTAVVELAAVIEMIHLATLAHDDVIDQAPSRRNRPALWKLSNTHSAVLEGDFIFSRAFRLLNPHPYEIRQLIIEAVEHVLEGELLQESLRWQLPSIEEYERVIQRKTAALMSASCTLGALLGNPDLEPEERDSIQRAGLLLGTAYQIVDDLLDVFGDEALGKPTGSDQKGGWLTGPYIRLVEQSGDVRIRELVQKRELTEPERGYLLEQMARYHVRQQFFTQAERQISEAKELLRWIADSDLKELLLNSLDFVVTRRS